MDPKVKLTPLQIDVVEFLHKNEGTALNWRAIQKQFPGNNPDQECDERLSESVWGLIDAGLVFEPKGKPNNYHLTEEACRQAPQIIAGKAEAEAAEQREIARLNALGRRGRPVVRADTQTDDADYVVRNRGMDESPKKPAKEAKSARGAAD